MHPFIANTDRAWFEFLASRSDGTGRVDEVNFWSPRATRPMRRMAPGEPVFLRLKSPVSSVAGYGFFAHFAVMGLEQAWECFGWKNGDPSAVSFLQRIGGYRGMDLLDRRAPREPLGCTVLRDVRFWPRERWIPWGDAQGWPRNVVQGRTEHDPARAARLLGRVAEDALHCDTAAEWTPTYELVTEDERRVLETRQVAREGQGTFRSRLLDVYGGRCAITGEHTEPVLDAAHIQPYLGPRSNHLQNGLVLTKEFHTLFDLGYVTITPDYTVRVSSQIRDTWHNGRRYYEHDDRRLIVLPAEAAARPSAKALAWHNEARFRG